MLTKESLEKLGYTQISEYEFKKFDEKSGMFVTLSHNPNGSMEQNRQIEQEIMDILVDCMIERKRK